MSDSFQDVYAKYLQHADYGYPLRMPEPMSTLPQNYQDSGLEIGDVGIVDNRGQFDVLFNICKRSDNLLHDTHGVPKNFQPVQHGDVKSSDNAICAGPIHSHGIKRVLKPNKPRPVDYEFDSSTRAGAILILPHGAVSAELLSPERFRKLAAENALDWYEFARQRYGIQQLDRSLYLITGFYKARSWSLGSFSNPSDDTGKILARKDDNNPDVYILEFNFSADCRHSRGSEKSGSINQTVFITGFKITVSSWLPDPVVLRVTESQTTWTMLVCLFKTFLNRLCSFSGVYERLATISVEHSPQLSQPFHPSDIINRFLLKKNPNARVAITHDNQWMEMMKEGLTHEELLQDDRLETFLSRCYTISVESERENTAVFLQGIADGTTGSISSVVDPRDLSPELEVSDSPVSELDVSSPPTSELEFSLPTTPEPEVSSPPNSELEYSRPLTPSLDCPCIVITRIRAQNIPSGLKRIPVGFYVLVQFDGYQRRTQNKPMRLNDSGIEWEDEIPLPSRAFGKFRFTIYASFELEPMLGSGEALYTSESPAEEFVGGTYLITFSPAELVTRVPNPSLLITLGRWYSNHLAIASSGNDSDLSSEESSALVRETNLGQEALLRYHNEYRRDDLQNAVQHFECAWQSCPLTHRCCAAVLVNFAKAKSISYHTDPTSANLEEVIRLYRQAHNRRPPGHSDRPATLLQLAQTLLFHYEKQGYDESVADEIRELMTEFQCFSRDSHERRAADLLLETLERYRAVNSGDLAELDGLVQKLEDSARVPPDGYFDISQRLINLSTALWRRYEKRGVLDDLNRSLDINKQALQVLPARDPGRLPCLRTLGAALWRLFELRRDLSYLRELIALDEEALQLILEGHPEHPYWATNYKGHHAEMLEYFGNVAFAA
ncbi:hypothetical protein PISMIDRAFT_679577 [Pisolithus microcarpus 441]|uniref:C2 domain-containing protein n=1 Tax=Pisolithus microcarpus 441 TaxID=765257 RepID=A0A0C9Z293_9AGAM|nr:hypothetical protein BKA83DRAFT_679577 [Pisolithus microcarpus]KIK23166.1 hypothetical protein PISMIDRAFT_679577 [Pisolithus microcarpus 441]